MSDINVTIVAATNASTSILNSDVVNVSAGPGFVGGGATALLVEAGANITVTTAQGAFVVSGQSAPVQSVQGRTGNVTLTRADLTAASLTHTHATTDIVGLTAVAAGASPVQSVQGRTGTVVLTRADLTAAELSHTHATTDIVGLTSTIQEYGRVVSVNGQTGTVTLTVTDLTAAAASHTHSYAAVSHTHSTSAIVNLTATIQQYGAVSSVNGRTGTVVLTVTDLTAATATHTHSYAAVSHTHATTDIVNLTATIQQYGAVVSVNSRTGAVSIVGGANVEVATNTSSIVISAAQTPGPQGPPGTFGDPQTISRRTASFSLVLSDVGTLITLAATSGSTVVTIPDNTAVAWVSGSHIDIARLGAGTASVSAAAGVSLTSSGTSLRQAGSAGTLVYLGTNSWLLVGDLA